MNKDTQFVCKKTNRIYGYENCTSFVDPDFVPGCGCVGYCMESKEELQKREQKVEQAIKALS